MPSLTESNWQGWNPALYSNQGIEGAAPRYFTRMDNCVIDEVGVVRNSKGYSVESQFPFTTNVNTIFATIFDLNAVSAGPANARLRYVYTSDGTLKRNWETAGSQSAFARTIFTAGNYPRCQFLAAMGHVFCISGAKKYQDHGDTARALGIAAPPTPTSGTSGAGVLDGDYVYITVDVDNNGEYLEFSLNSNYSTPVTAALNSVDVTRAAVAANANESWLFRWKESVGAFLLVDKQAGAYGFSPSVYTDNTSDEDIVAAAAQDPLRNLEPYRSELPNDIIGLIWFKDRIIYLSENSFFPSYKFDAGSYDSRFRYELNGGAGEKCLFVAKLDVGTFVIATTKDFYRVTGSFGAIATNETEAQDVNILPLGVSDPAISSQFLEIEGTLMYVSSTGIRTLANGTSTLINGPLDLLFRNESRHGIPPILLGPADTSTIACASSGKRIYWSLPHTDGFNRLYILTMGDTPSWRLWGQEVIGNNPRHLCRELETGAVLGCGAGSADNYLYSLETVAAQMPIYLETPFNYAGSPLNRKDSLGFTSYINTGGSDMALTIFGLLTDGTVASYNIVINTVVLTPLSIDIKNWLGKVLAFKVKIAGTTNEFQLEYFIINYEMRPTTNRRAITYGADFGKTGRKCIANWPFRLNSLTSTNQIAVNLYADGSLVDNQGFSSLTSKIQDIPYNYGGAVLARVWEIEIIGTEDFEFYEFLAPDFSYICPAPTSRGVFPASNFGKPGRKNLNRWGIKVNPRGANTITIIAKGDNNTLGTLAFSPGVDQVLDLDYITATASLATVFELEWTSTAPLEFYEFLEPQFNEITPAKTNRVYMPLSELGAAGRKTITCWPFKINPLGHDVTVNVYQEGHLLNTTIFQNLTSDIQVLNWLYSGEIAAKVWEIEVLCPSMEFYEFLKPEFSRQFPTVISRIVSPASNFGKNGRKMISVWPLRVDLLGNETTVKVLADGVALPQQQFNFPRLQTIFWKNTLNVAAVDWEIEVVSPTGMEFYEFLPPEVAQSFPTKVYFARLPSTNFGKAEKKKIATWPLVANLLGNNATINVKIDGVSQAPIVLNNNTIQTLFWRNMQDVAGIDWEMEVVAANGMELYRFMDPTVLQVFPPGRLIDQLGPLDFNRKGLIYQLRLRLINEGTNISYTIYSEDTAIHAGNLTTTPNEDTPYIIKFPKGIDPSVCRVILHSTTVFYRFSAEFKITLSGKKDTEATYIAL